MKFYMCEHCGKIIHFDESLGVPVRCCEEPMKELVANTVDASLEKHVPVAHVDGNQVKVKVGSVDHPMTEEHHIAWIAIKTPDGSQIKYLDHTGKPEETFTVIGNSVAVQEVYAYCNLHGLWRG